jgi:putative ABC transport system permease protein
LNLALRLARRELRGGIRGLRVVLACLALGVAAIAGVGSLRAGIEAGLQTDGARILGGDIAVQGGAGELPDTLRTWLHARGARISDVTGMRSMLIAANGRRLLVELKAVDAAWPLIGTARFAPEGALKPGAIAVEPIVLDRLGVQPGAEMQLGRARFTLQSALTDEPDRVSTPSILGPRVLMRLDDLPATALVQPGSIVEHQLRAAFPAGTDIARQIDDLRAAFPNTGWRIRTARDAAPNVSQFLDRTSLFMTLVGLTSLLVGGIGVANGVRAWLEGRARSIAILRCLGASPRLVFAVCALQVAALAGFGIAIGLAAGAALPLGAAALLGNVLPVSPAQGLFAGPLLLAAGYGVLIAAAFALGPLARAMNISGAALFRDATLPQGGRRPAWVIATLAALVLALVGLTVATAVERGFALGFCGAALATLALFRAGAWALMAVAARVRATGHPALRLALGNLHRPGTATPLMLVSVGIGLSTLAAVALIQGNVQLQVADQLPARAPTFFFIDIQNSQMDRFRSILAAEPGVTDMQEVPSLRARLVSVAGVPADQVKATPDTAWALRGDRGLTYAAAMPKGTKIVAGHWWPADYHGAPQLSLDANIARGWGVKLGDVVRVNVLGRDIDLTVTSLRDIQWRSMGINFTFVASPGLLDHAPHTHIATVRTSEASQGRLLRAVTDALPNVSGILVADILAAVGALFAQIGTALMATGSLTLAAGALVLAGAVAAGQRRRIAEAVILRSLGATSAQLRTAWLAEFGVLGATAGVIACAIGTGASYAVVHFVMGTEWAFLPVTLAATVLGCILLMLLFGLAGTEAALHAKAAPLLRNE